MENTQNVLGILIPQWSLHSNLFVTAQLTVLNGNLNKKKKRKNRIFIYGLNVDYTVLDILNNNSRCLVHFKS